MTIAAPIILLPTSSNFTTDIEVQTLSGTTDINTHEIQVNGSAYGVSYTEGEVAWSWTGTLSLGVNTINITAIEKTTLEYSIATTIIITLVQQSNFITINPPTGIKILRYQDKMEIVNTANTEVNTLGYNYYVSTKSGGINNTYAKINKQIINAYTDYEDTTTLLSKNIDTVDNIRVTTITEELTRTYYYSVIFDQDRYTEMVNNGELPVVTFGENTPFYFVITAIIYDSVLGQVSESTNSIELEGSPITITTGLKTLPNRTQNDVILTFSQELLASNSGINTMPGTVVRDEIDPISEEFARMYVIQNFLAVSLSISALLDFDDANGDGISDPVSTSIPKRALQIAFNLTDPSDVQTLIDSQFDKLASNVDTTRQTATYAIGNVIFYASNPIRDMVINEGAVVSSPGDLDQGVPAQSYITLATKILSYINREQYYNIQTNRYEVTVDVQAMTSGETGNTDSYTIKTISSGADSDFQVENPNAISFGQDIESNHDLAGRTELAMFADTGTKGGYAKVAANISGVKKVRVEKANDPLMIRDYDPIRNKHVGGKVDVYIQGSKTQQVEDQLAFSFESIVNNGQQSGETFSIINTNSYQFKCKNTRVTAHTPIFEVSKVYNVTKSSEYDITGYQIVGDGDTIDLNETLNRNVIIGIATLDIIKVDYKFRSSDTFVLSHQPVKEIISVTGQLSGVLTTDNYELVTLQDPLDEGGSTIASDSIRIKFANNLPLTEFQTISDESHVMILDKYEFLDYIGADTESIIIRNESKNTTYSENIDYRIIPGTDTVATSTLLIESGHIENGQKILVSYQAIENFIIVYTTNSLLSTVQAKIDLMKHACADAIVKQTIENKVDYSLTVVPKSSVVNKVQLKSKIGTAISNYQNQLGIGIKLTQSDVIHEIKKITDINYLVLPLSRMVKADGSFIVRDNIGKTQFILYNIGVVNSYISTVSILTYKTIDKGGPDNKFKGVFEDSLPLILQDDPIYVSEGAGRAYIQSDGKIIVSTKDGQLPDIHSYESSYYVYGETGSNDIDVASIESLIVGSLNIVIDDSINQQTVL